MNENEFMDYIRENFNTTGAEQRLIDNILYYVKCLGIDGDEQYLILSALLDGTIGLSDNEIKQICL